MKALMPLNVICVISLHNYTISIASMHDPSSVHQCMSLKSRAPHPAR